MTTAGKVVTGFFVIMGALVIGGMLVYIYAPGEPAVSSEPSLRVTAGRGLFQFTITNREDVSLNDCRFYIDDGDGATWSALYRRDIAPLESASVDWGDFSTAGQTMPSYVKDRAVHVNCALTGTSARRNVRFVGR